MTEAYIESVTLTEIWVFRATANEYQNLLLEL